MERQAQADQGVKPVLTWIGSKEKLQRIIRSAFPPDHDRLAEHFGGSASILLGRRRARGVMEVYNDYDNDLVNFILCLRDRVLCLLKELNLLPIHSEAEFHLLRRYMLREDILRECIDSEMEVVEEFFTGREREELLEILQGRADLLDVRRAAAFFRVNRGCYNGKMDAFGVKAVNIRKLLPGLLLASQRLEGVTITNRDCVASIRLNDKPKTLHYNDPPYFKAEKMYNVPFGPADHVRLHAALKECEGYVVVSYNECDYILDLYSDFYIMKFTRKNDMSHLAGSEYKEVIITNYDPRPIVARNTSQMSMFGPPDLEQVDAKLALIHKPIGPTEWEKKYLK